jgi:hypothetical protein
MGLPTPFGPAGAFKESGELRWQPEMSKPRLLLTASLICNAILLVWAALPGSSSGDSRAPAGATAEPASSSLNAWFAKLSPTYDAAPRAASERVAGSGYSEAGWTRSLRDDIAELRERGLDDSTVRMLALAEAERLFRERAQAVLAPRQRPEYWDVRRQSLRVDATQLATFQRLRREKLAVIAELVGPDAVSSERNTPHTFMAGPLMTLDYLPTEKRLAVTEHLETSELELRANATPLARLRRGGSAFGAATFMEHEVARDAQIRLILGPQLYEEYLRRSSETARRLRSQLTAFRPTRTEFDALVAIAHEHGSIRTRIVAFGAEAGPAKMRTVADQQTNAIRAVLGEQRYADYERSRDHSTVMLDRLVNELQVAPEAARASFEILEQARARLQTLMSRAQDPAQREAIQRDFGAVRRQLHSDLAETLGLEELSESELATLLGEVDLSMRGRER